MKVYRITTASSQLNSFASDNWDEVGNLMKFILNNDMENEFNQLMNIRFRDGVGEDEFKKHCIENADFLIEDLKRNLKGGNLA